jgi:MFS family permease
MYVAELAPPKYRGRLMLAFQIAIGVGIVIATVVGASESIVWRWSIGIAAVPAAIMLALLLRLPESPRWLVHNGDRDAAEAVLRRVRPSGFDVDGELDEMDLARKEQNRAPGRHGRAVGRAVGHQPAHHADPAQQGL